MVSIDIRLANVKYLYHGNEVSYYVDNIKSSLIRPVKIICVINPNEVIENDDISYLEKTFNKSFKKIKRIIKRASNQKRYLLVSFDKDDPYFYIYYEEQLERGVLTILDK